MLTQSARVPAGAKRVSAQPRRGASVSLRRSPTRRARRRADRWISVEVASNEVRTPIGEARVRDVVRAVCEQERVRAITVSVTFVSKARIAQMNRDFLGHTGATDIITFELQDTDGVPLGDVYIAPEVARANALAHGVGIREELVRLVVHGTLHVLGYTHPEEGRTSSAMWRKQEALVAALV